jgi:RNA-binding protein
MTLELSPTQRRFLRQQAHNIDPVVMVGNNGLSDAVMREIAKSLDVLELIKIRVHGDDRALREGFYLRICNELGAAPVQHIGKLLVIYRPGKEPKITLPKIRRKAAAG